MTTGQNEIAAQEAAGVSPAGEPGPRGIGTAVVFDWGVAVQTGILAPFFALGTGPGDATAGFPTAGRIGVALVFVGIAVGGAIFGEALRRGYRPVWLVQVIANALLVVLGLHDLPATIQSAQGGHFGLLVHTLVLLIVSPVAAWLLTRPSTRRWLAQTTSAQARARHSGRWLVTILLCSLISGVVIALGNYY